MLINIRLIQFEKKSTIQRNWQQDEEKHNTICVGHRLVRDSSAVRRLLFLLEPWDSSKKKKNVGRQRNLGLDTSLRKQTQIT
jgi:hypothetical protein